MDLLLYAPQLSPRLQYIVTILCNSIGIKGFQVTDQPEVFKSFTAAKINYSNTPVAGIELHIQPNNLLFETSINPQKIECFTWNELPAFFKVENGDVPFDVLAASFYLISRYEEYLPHNKDEYDRYAHTNSVAFTYQFLHVPLVNSWMQQVKNLLLQRFPNVNFQPVLFTYVPTYDIDMAWSYFGKGVVRNAAGLLRSLLNGDVAAARERLSVVLDFSEDPFDIYQWLDSLHEKHALLPVYFFLVAKHTGQYDKNISIRNKYFKLLISKISVMYPSGIHPSWQSGDKPALLQQEIAYLHRISRKPIVNSRQHYIRMTLPETYRQLLSNGIQNDYSMGYGSINGFRASYCMPYKWYDLQADKATSLTIYPFCYMEANSLFEQKLTPDQAFDELKHYHNVVRQVNGMLITIFHNHLLSNQPGQAAWKQLYERFLGKIL